MVTSRFNAADLSKLLKKPNACVFLRKCKRHLALTPKALNNINDSVLVHLNRLVRKFDPELDAVVLGCRNVSILTNLGTIVDDSPHVHIDIEAEFYLFKPEKDSLLSGVVNKKSRDNIGCLVHDIFNVSIPIEPDEGIDIDNISIGQTLTFCVVVVDFSHPIPFIKGKLIDSGVRSPSKLASEGKKRKRSDQLEVCKKIKLEIDSPLPTEDNVNTFTPPIKFPMSILKKATPFGVESSPARRISFFGDVPEAPTDETNTSGGKAKKKKKKESKTSHLEESPSQQKKKKTVTSLENEPETDVGIKDSREINSDSTGNKKVKKKKSEQMGQVNDFADEPEQDFNILQDFKVHSKKTKNEAFFENASKLKEVDEISKEMNAHSASHLKTKKKKKKHEISEGVSGTYNASNIHEKVKKQGSREENERLITGENYQDQEQINKSHTLKKSKKSKKMALNEQENTSYATSKGEYSEEKAQSIPHKRKKRTSEEEGKLKIAKINFAEIIDKTVEDWLKIKKSKEKGISEVDAQRNESSVSSPKKQKPNFANEIEPGRKSLRKDKKDPLETLTSLPRLSGTEKQHLQESILEAVQLKPVDKKKKSKKISQECVEVSDSRVHDYIGKKDKSFSDNRKVKRIINSSTIADSNRLQENQYSGRGDNSFESLSPIKKSDDDDEEEEEPPSGFITSTQIEGSKTKKMVSNAKSFSNLNEVSMRNSFSDSDSFDVEEFSLGYMPQNVKEKKESKDHIASRISSQERKSQISSDSIEATNSIKDPSKHDKRSDIVNNSNSAQLEPSSLFTSKKNMAVRSMSQKGQSKSSGADSSSSSSSSSSSDSESHSHEQHNILQESKIKSTEGFSPKSMVLKGVQTGEESDSVKNNEHAAAKEKKKHSSNKQMKVQSRTLTSTKRKGNESNDADSTDSDLPTFLHKPIKLPLIPPKSGNLHEPVVSSSNVHKKGTRKSKITDGEPHNIEAKLHLNPQKQGPKSPGKNIFGKPKSKGMDSNTSHSDSSLLLVPKTTTLKQVHASHKKHDPVSSVDSNLPLTKMAKPTTQKQFPVSYQEHGSDSSSSDSSVPSSKHLPSSKAAKTTLQKHVPVSHKKQDSVSSSVDLNLPSHKAAKPATQKQIPIVYQEHGSNSSSSDSDLPLAMDVPLAKAAKTTTQKQFPVSHKKQASVSSSVNSNLPLPRADKPATRKPLPVSHQEHNLDSSSSDSDLPLAMDVPPAKAAKTTTQKQFPVSHKKQASVSSSVNSNLPLPRADKPATRKPLPVSHQEHNLDSSSSDSDLPLAMDVPLAKAAKTTTQKQFPVSHKKQASVSSVNLNLPLSRVAKLATQKQFPVSYQEHGSDSSSSDSEVPSSKHLPSSKAAQTTIQKQVPVSHKKQASVSSSVNSNLPLPRADKPATRKQLPVSHQKHNLDSSSSDSDLPLTKAAKTTQKQVLFSHKKHRSDSSSFDSDLPLTMDVSLSKRAKTTTQKPFPGSYKKHDSNSSSSDSDLPSSKNLPPSKAAKTTTQKHLLSHKKHGSESSSSDSDLPLDTSVSLSKAPKTITQKQFPVSHKEHDSDGSIFDSDVPSSKAARKTAPKQVSVTHEKHVSGSSSSDSDLPLFMDLPLSKAAKMTTQTQFPVSDKKHKSDSSSDSELSLSKAAKTQKQSSASNKKAQLHSSNSISDLSSHLRTSVVKQVPLSPDKSFSSVAKKNSGREMVSQADAKVSTSKKKDTNASKHVKHQSGSNEKKSSGRETNLIVKDLLAKVKTEILNSPAKSGKSSKTGKMEESKKASKEKHGANSLHTNEKKGKKTNNSKETVVSSKHSKEPDVNSVKKHEVKETSEELEDLTDELLKNMLLKKDKKK